MPSKPQLFLIHFAGGNRYSFDFMIPFLTKFNVITLELPGRGNRIKEGLINDLELASEDIYSQILNKLNASKFVIFGHSMGAIITLKVASMLEHFGAPPSHLFVSGHEGPNICKNKKRYLLNDSELIQEIRKFGGTSDVIIQNNDFLEYFLPIIRADLEIAEKQSDFKLTVSIPIYALMGSKEENAHKISNWVNFTNSDFKAQLFNGGHFFIYDYPKEISAMITKTFENSNNLKTR